VVPAGVGLYEQGLVQVRGGRGIDGDELDGGQVVGGELQGFDGCFGVSHSVVRVGAGQLQLGPQRTECRLERVVMLMDVGSQPMV
jgi:hypothetical protein